MRTPHLHHLRSRNRRAAPGVVATWPGPRPAAPPHGRHLGDDPRAAQRAPQAVRRPQSSVSAENDTPRAAAPTPGPSGHRAANASDTATSKWLDAARNKNAPASRRILGHELVMPRDATASRPGRRRGPHLTFLLLHRELPTRNPLHPRRLLLGSTLVVKQRRPVDPCRCLRPAPQCEASPNNIGTSPLPP